MCRLLAHRIGTVGMAGGQAIDLESVGKRIDLAALQDMHRRKTGALIEASVLLGAVAAGVTSGPAYQALQDYSAAIGLAFQIQDDILDATQSAKKLGKTAGKDATAGKMTFPALYGLEKSRALAAQWTEDAIGALKVFGSQGRALRALAEGLLTRDK